MAKFTVRKGRRYRATIIPPEIVKIEEIEAVMAAGARTMRAKRKPKAPAKRRRKTSTTRRKARG